MKRLLPILIGLLLSATANAETIPVVGTIRTPAGARFNGTVRMTLNFPARDSCSSNIVVPSVVTFRVNNGTLVTGPITPNDCLQPSNTIYVTEYFTTAGAKVMQNNFYIGTAAQFDLGTATPTALTSSNISFNVFTGLTDVETAIINNAYTCQRTGANASAKILAAVNATPSTGGVVDCRGLQGAQTIGADIFGGTTKPIILLLGAATFTVTATIYVPASSHIVGMGRGTKFVASSSLTLEAIRLQGDYSSIEKVWLTGPGQGTGTLVDGRRGIWIGCGVSQLAGCISYYNRVENVEVDNFIGNGIAGDMQYAKIVNNDVHHNTDANIFLQPLSQYNLLQGNTIYSSRYSGIDLNGDNNRILSNEIYSNGGGALDINSWNGIVIAWTGGTHGSNNIVSSNHIYDNQGCGVLVQGLAATAAVVDAPYGNVITQNVISGHATLTGTPSGLTHNQWFGGVCIEGGNNTLVANNVSRANAFNYIVASTSAGNSLGIQIVDNQSFDAAVVAAISATTSGVGYYFPGSSRIDGVGGSPATNVLLQGNQDANSAKDSYRWALDTATGANNWFGWTIKDNKSNRAGAYGFDLVSAGNFANYTYRDNYATNATTAAEFGWTRLGLTANSATPSVANGNLFVTQNSVATTLTNFTSGSFGQVIGVLVNDSATTVGFASGNLKGNSGVNYQAASGDALNCQYDGTNWYCTIAQVGGFPQGNGSGVTQLVSKSTAVTINAPSGNITMNNAALSSATSPVSFTMTNSAILGTSDIIFVTPIGGPNAGYYYANAAVTGVGGATVSVSNLTSGSFSNAVILGFQIRHQ